MKYIVKSTQVLQNRIYYYTSAEGFTHISKPQGKILIIILILITIGTYAGN